MSARYFVACQEMVDELWTYGVDKEKIKVTGIPVRPEFGITLSPSPNCGRKKGCRRTGR